MLQNLFSFPFSKTTSASSCFSILLSGPCVFSSVHICPCWVANAIVDLT